MKKGTVNKIIKLYTKILPICAEVDALYRTIKKEEVELLDKMREVEVQLEITPDNGRLLDKSFNLDEKYEPVSCALDSLDTIYSSLGEILSNYQDVAKDLSRDVLEEEFKLPDEVKIAICKQQEAASTNRDDSALPPDVSFQVIDRKYNEAENLFLLIMEVTTSKTKKPHICEFKWSSKTGIWENTYMRDPLPPMRYKLHTILSEPKVQEGFNTVFTSKNGENSININV